MTTFYNVPLEEIEERSLYMRLFRSWLDGDKFYHAAFCGEAIHRLLEVGHVEAVGQGYVITNAGKKAWAVMCVLLINRTSIRRESETVNQVLKQIYDDEREEHMGNLMSELRRFLALVDNDVATTVRDFDKTVLMTAVKQRYAERLEPKVYRITAAGRAWLRENGATVKAETAAPKVNFDALIHRLLAGQTIMRAELATKEEQEFFRRLQREVHVTVSGDGFVITRGGREAFDDFGQDAPEEAAPAEETAFSEPAEDKPAKRKYTRREPRASGGPVETQPAALMAADPPLEELFVPNDKMLVINKQDCGDCDCLPRRVLAAVIDVRPDVRELFELMMREEQLLRDLGKR